MYPISCCSQNGVQNEALQSSISCASQLVRFYMQTLWELYTRDQQLNLVSIHLKVLYRTLRARPGQITQEDFLLSAIYHWQAEAVGRSHCPYLCAFPLTFWSHDVDVNRACKFSPGQGHQGIAGLSLTETHNLVSDSNVCCSLYWINATVVVGYIVGTKGNKETNRWYLSSSVSLEEGRNRWLFLWLFTSWVSRLTMKGTGGRYLVVTVNLGTTAISQWCNWKDVQGHPHCSLWPERNDSITRPLMQNHRLLHQCKTTNSQLH